MNAMSEPIPCIQKTPNLGACGKTDQHILSKRQLR